MENNVNADVDSIDSHGYHNIRQDDNAVADDRDPTDNLTPPPPPPPRRSRETSNTETIRIIDWPKLPIDTLYSTEIRVERVDDIVERVLSAENRLRIDRGTLLDEVYNVYNGDRIISINGQSVELATTQEIVAIFKKIPYGSWNVSYRPKIVYGSTEELY